MPLPPELRDILFLDIETVRGAQRYGDLSERMRVQWSRKASYLRKEDPVTDEDLYSDRAGIYAEFGKIVCIGVAMLHENTAGEPALKVKCYAGHDERALLTDFGAMLSKLDTGAKLCAHNGKEFDFPYLSRRFLVQGVALPFVLDLAGKKPWEVNHLDTLEYWKFGDYKHYTSLDLLAAIFNIPSSKGTMDGSQVNTVYYGEKNLDKIVEYCRGDVVTVAQLFLKMKGHGLISESNIIRA
jgi:hypothetical protein